MRFVLFGIFSALCAAQTREMGPKQILTKLGETYRNLKSFNFEVSQHSSANVRGVDFGSVNFDYAGVRPDKSYLYQKGPATDLVCVNDGETVWTCLPKQKQFMKHSGAAVEGDDDLQSSADDDPMAAAQKLLIGRYTGLAALSKLAAVRKEESVKVGGGKFDCWVVEIRLPKGAGTHEMWIDESRYIVLKHVETHDTDIGGTTVEVKTTLVWKKADIESAPDARLFTFEPGKANEVEVLNIPGQRNVTLTGTHAADFKLKDLDGNEVALSGLRGKVVVLDFWASWCGPCRQELPSIQKLYEAYRGSDLMIFGINDEDAHVARGFLKKAGYTFPILMDANRKVNATYHVRSIPRVIVIDRNGIIAKMFVGTRSEGELRSAFESVLR